MGSILNNMKTMILVLLLQQPSYKDSCFKYIELYHKAQESIVKSDTIQRTQITHMLYYYDRWQFFLKKLNKQK